MKKLFNKDNMINLGITLIGSIIFMQIITPAMEIIKNIGNGIVTALIDYYYYSCGHASNTGFISTVAYMVLIIVFSILMGVLSSIKFPSKPKNSSKEEPQSIISGKNEKGTINDIENQLLEIENKFAQIQEHVNNIEVKKLKSQMRQAVIARIFLVLLTCWLIIILTYEYSPLMRKEAFDRNIIQIAPYVDEVELMHLKSEWVSMETQEEYFTLKEKIQSIKEANGIK